jgi:GNAT superfamily N-acetyltransferase
MSPSLTLAPSGVKAEPDFTLRRLESRLPRFIPGRLEARVSLPQDYRALSRFHYRAGPPATWARVLRIDHAPANAAQGVSRPIAIAVLSWPTAVSRPRRERFGLSPLDFGGQLRFANRQLRTISRVIVHPQFRGLGLASLLVRGMIDLCPTRYVEATAAMGVVHPLFERAGMTRLACLEEGPAYFWFDRWRKSAWA